MASSNRSIYVKPIPMDVNEEEIKVFFQRFGDVTAVTFPPRNKVHPDLLAKYKRYVFVEFENPRSAQEALQTNGRCYWGNKLEINPAIHTNL